ncbi:hypothetical protein CAEBREN_31201 [Caenorhabditis brenneri]|uniref:Uncharacterized protein n=1 Tax=Caenorhabditis brenneri TaxID=135651 RepID=G0MU78_CAEBE|nr:hypothetical protein CAEBREN_31201 [Caenorhabditis brenneri]
MKTVHSGDFDSYYTKNDDLVPFVSYSLNKKSRWKNTNALELLEELQNGNSEVFVIERIDIHCSPYRCYVPFPQYFKYFPIQNLHTLNNSCYEHISVNSALGQPLKSLLLENRLPMKPKSNDLLIHEPSKVAVNLIRPPKNFEKLRSRYFYSGRGDAKDYRADVYKKRFKAIDDMVFEVKYDQLDVEDEVMDTFEDDYLFNEKLIRPSQ